MKFKATAAALLALGLLSSAAQAAKPQQDDNLIGLSTPNGKLAFDFINLWFNERKPNEAFDQYVSRDHYQNHAVYSASVNKHLSFEQEKAGESGAMGAPSHKFEIKQLISQGSLVFAHIHVVVPDGPGNELVILLRIRDGKVTDHWDLHEKLKPDSSVFVDLDR